MRYTIVLLFISLFYISKTNAQLIEANQFQFLGNEISPHLLIQTRADSMARTFAFTQLEEILDTCCKNKQFLKKDIELKQKELLALLAVNKIKSHLSNTIKNTLLFDLSPKQDSKEVVRKSLNGELDFSHNLNFLNRVLVNIKLNKLTYNIDPSRIEIKKLDAEATEKGLLFHSQTYISGIDIEAKDICISFSTFEKVEDGNDWKIIKKDSDYQCDNKDKIDQKIDEFLENYIAKKEMPKNIQIRKEALGEMSYLRNVGIHISGIKAQTKDITPFIINLSFLVGLNDGNLSFKITEGSFQKLLSQATNDAITKRVELTFFNGQVAHIYGLSGFIIEDTPILFTDVNINEALEQRQKELLELLITPLVEDLEKMTETLKNNMSFQMAGKFKVSENKSIGYNLSQIGFLPTENQEQLSLGFNFNFNNKVTSLNQDVPLIQDLIADLRDKISKPNMENQSETDIIISLGEHLFNDAIHFALENYSEPLKKLPLSLKDISFNIDHLPESINLAHQDSLPLHSSYLSGCVEVMPKKKFQRFLLKVILGKEVNVPLFAFIDIKVINENNVPTIYFDIPFIESDPHFLAAEEDCKLSKRFKKLASKISGKMLDKKFNSFQGLPLVKIALNPLRGIPHDLLSLEFDRTHKRMNIMVSLKEETHLKQDIIQKIEVTSQKIQVQFPKIDAMGKK